MTTAFDHTDTILMFDDYKTDTILDFRFWIGKRVPSPGFANRSVTSILQIGMNNQPPQRSRIFQSKIQNLKSIHTKARQVFVRHPRPNAYRDCSVQFD
jgi:hypothetical protein